MKSTLLVSVLALLSLASLAGCTMAPADAGTSSSDVTAKPKAKKKTAKSDTVDTTDAHEDDSTEEGADAPAEEGPATGEKTAAVKTAPPAPDVTLVATSATLAPTRLSNVIENNTGIPCNSMTLSDVVLSATLHGEQLKTFSLSGTWTETASEKCGIPAQSNGTIQYDFAATAPADGPAALEQTGGTVRATAVVDIASDGTTGRATLHLARTDSASGWEFTMQIPLQKK